MRENDVPTTSIRDGLTTLVDGSDLEHLGGYREPRY